MRSDVAFLLATVMCLPSGPALAQTPAAPAPAVTAHATLNDAAGRTIGDASLKESPNGVLISVNLTAAPAGVHAFHVHQVGKCEPPKFDSAGPHLGASAKQHGFLNDAGPHAGDLPNVHVPADGKLAFEVFLPGTMLGQGSTLLDADGAALMLHASADDYRTNPAGAAGDRIACGVVEK